MCLIFPVKWHIKMEKKIQKDNASKKNESPSTSQSKYFTSSFQTKPVTFCNRVAKTDLACVLPLIKRFESSTACSKESVSAETTQKLQQFSFHETQNFESTALPCDMSSSDVAFQHAAITTKKEDDTPLESCRLTPLEKQYLELKKEHPETLLLIECGYKYRMFGNDAEVASKELNICCYMCHNFLSASIPNHRLSVHVRRLVANGHKVGVVKQTESAALKAAGDNKNTLFSRKLYALYTKSTLIGEEFNSQNEVPAEECGDKFSCLGGYLVCIYDKPITSIKKLTVNVAVVAVRPTTGDILYSSFVDTAARPELESCLMHINPVEILLPASGLSEATENFVQSVLDASSVTNKIRIQRTRNEAFDFTCALENVSKFYGSTNSKQQAEEDLGTQTNGMLRDILSMSPSVICCLSALIAYLTEFGLESILRNWKHSMQLSNSSKYMALNAVTLRNLEIFQNCCDSSPYGSLFWTINYTRTKFGEQMLKCWIARPLRDLRQIGERHDAVTEVLLSDSSVLNILERMLSKLPDLEKLLCAAFYHRCSCSEFVTLVKTLVTVKKNMATLSERITVEIQTSKLKKIISEVILLLENVEIFLNNINEKSARNEEKTKLFLDTSKYSLVVNCEKKMKIVETKLNDQLATICQHLCLPSFCYSTVSGQKYLIEVKNSDLPIIPSNWMKISGTKQVSRFRSPEVDVLYSELRQLSEELVEYCNAAWHCFLDEFKSYFYKYKRAVSCLAELDCIFSFAELAKQEGFCRPKLANDLDRQIFIVQGKNPIIAKLATEKRQYVANDTALNFSKRCMIITGPNMGGKSSYVRQVALLAVLAQAGSYIPAISATFPLFDGIYIRTGANDHLVLKRSTFLTEMCETSDILSSASPNSLVILDELGRGTSTRDGAVIAHATLCYLLNEVMCAVLFVTHYPHVVKALQTTYPDNVVACHVAFEINNCGSCHDEERKEGQISEPDDVTFLYNITSGIARNSYGINVARLAGIPEVILSRAKQISLKYEKCIEQKSYAMLFSE